MSGRDSRPGGRTRRQLVGGLAAAAAGAAWAGAAAVQADADSAPPVDDLTLLGQLLGAEHMLLYSYRRVLASRTLHPTSLRIARLAMGHEREHVQALHKHIRRVGGGRSPTVPPISSDVTALFGKLVAERQAVQTILEVESLAQGTYFAAIGQLQGDSSIRLAAEIMACEAQHSALLNDLLNHGIVSHAVPSAFVRGSTKVTPVPPPPPPSGQ